MACLMRFEDTLGFEKVNFFVGPFREHFVVHKELVRQNVPVFDTMFKSSSSEGLKKSVYLPEDESGIFKTFLDWLYADELDEIVVDKRNPWRSQALIDRMKLMLFAETYCIDILADYAIDTILLAHRAWGVRDFKPPTLEVIEMVYDNTLPDSGLRLFLVKCAAICYDYSSPGPSETEIQSYLKNRNAHNILKLLKEYKEEWSNQFADLPSKAPICDYHRHGGEMECFTRSRAQAVQEGW